jgi:hypothetical protein
LEVTSFTINDSQDRSFRFFLDPAKILLFSRRGNLCVNF